MFFIINSDFIFPWNVEIHCFIFFESLKENLFWKKQILIFLYGFGQAKFPNGGSVLGLIQISILPQQPPKIMLYSKVVKIDSNIIISLC